VSALIVRSIVLTAAVALTAGCGPHALANTQPSADTLAREVLAALAERDPARLHALALSEDEFEHRVWPGLPAARPERNMPWSYVWLELRQKSDAMLERTLHEYGGRRYALDGVSFAGETTNHGNYRVFRDTLLAVRDDRGVRHELRVLGSMIETTRGWKVFSYVVDR
jgi:hypothetical protein